MDILVRGHLDSLLLCLWQSMVGGCGRAELLSTCVQDTPRAQVPALHSLLHQECCLWDLDLCSTPESKLAEGEAIKQ